MTYEEPKAKVVHASRRDDVVTVVIEVSSLFSELNSPGGLYLVEKPDHKVIELHALKASDGNVLTYETYDHIGLLPTIGINYIYRLWWTTEQLQAVTNTARQWTYEVYPSNGDHDHCILSWEPIGAEEVHKTGYRSGKDWITEESYRTYIVNDKLRLRHRNK